MLKCDKYLQKHVYMCVYIYIYMHKIYHCEIYILVYPMSNKKGLWNALFGCNLNSELCIREPLLFYKQDPGMTSSKIASFKFHLNIIQTTPKHHPNIT